MAKCPKCGAKLHWYDFRAECKHCGVNIPNYKWEERLENDADTAETSFAKLHYKMSNFKYGTIGSPLMIVRLVFTLLPLVALVVPLVKITLCFPFYEKTESVSFLTFILNYLTKYDIKASLSLMHGEALGGCFAKMFLGVGFAFLAAALGVVNFFVVLIASMSLSSKADTVLNILSTVFWSLSAYFVYAFLNAAAETSVNIITGSVSPFFAVGIALFLANVIINIAVSKKFKNKKATDPSMEEAIEKELCELREKDSEPVAE